jgi:DNA-binding transcriptional LysR family regulator
MNFAALDLNLLRVFDAVMRERSTTRAGEILGLSQPAVSSALGRLRHIMGDELFVREGNRLVPTVKAEAIYQPVRDALMQIELAMARTTKFDPHTSRHAFRLFASDFFAQTLMPPLSTRVASEAPGIMLQLVDNGRGNMVQQLADRVVDLAVEPAREVPDWISGETAFHSSFLVVAARNHRMLKDSGIAPGDVIPLDLFCALPHAFCSPEGRTSGMVDQALDQIGKTRRVVLTLPQFHAVAVAVAAGTIVATLPTEIAKSEQSRLGLDIYRLPIAPPRAKLSLYWHKRHDDDAAHMWLRRHVMQILNPLDEGPL